MNKVRIVYKSDNSVAVIYPIPESKHINETENEWLNRVFNKAMCNELKHLEYDDIDIEKLPKTRKNRDSWRGKKGQDIWIEK